MPEQKTKETTEDPKDFIARQNDEQTRKDCTELVKMMKAVTGKPARMWGSAIIGFGRYEYTYASGHSGEACMIGFSPRKQSIALYIFPGASGKDMIKKLGKHKFSGSCLHIKRLEDVDKDVLRKMIEKGYGMMCKKHEK